MREKVKSSYHINAKNFLQRENFFMTRKELTKGENKFTLQRKNTET